MVKTTVEALGQLNVRQLLHPASYLTVYVGDDCERRNYRAQALSGAQPARMGEGAICMLHLY